MANLPGSVESGDQSSLQAVPGNQPNQTATTGIRYLCTNNTYCFMYKQQLSYEFTNSYKNCILPFSVSDLVFNTETRGVTINLENWGIKITPLHLDFNS